MEINKVSIVVPVFNEEEAIAADIATIKKTMASARWDYEIIVVNDASTDSTGQIAHAIEGITAIDHEENRGGGFSRNTGINASKGDVVVVTDGDGTYPVQDIPKLLEMMEEKDLSMVVGARTKEAGTLRLLRGPAKWFIRRLATALSGFKIPDLNSGLRAMRKEDFMPFMEILPWGHSWVSTITLAMLSSGLGVGYLDIDYYPRKGTSTFHPIKDTFGYLTLVVRTVMWFNPLKVFGPMALALGLIALAKVIFDFVNYHLHLTPVTVIMILASIQILAIGLLADLIVKRRG